MEQEPRDLGGALISLLGVHGGVDGPLPGGAREDRGQPQVEACLSPIPSTTQLPGNDLPPPGKMGGNGGVNSDFIGFRCKMTEFAQLTMIKLWPACK